MKSNIVFKLFVFSALYGTVSFCNTENLLTKESNNITISIPMSYRQLLQALLEKDPNTKTLQINTVSNTPEAVAIQLMKALLKRTDINSESIVKYIESGNLNTDDINHFHQLLQFEQERFTKNLLDQDNYFISFIKQLYHASSALAPYFVLHIAKWGYLAGSVYYFVIKTLFAPSALEFIIAVLTSVPLGIICLCFYCLFSNLDPSPDINSHWNQFNAWDMFIKFTKILNDSLLAATLIWTSYKLLTKIISQRTIIEALQKEIALAPTHSLFEATLYAFLGRLYDSGRLNNLEQLPGI
jgi:hypothetical protein